MVAGRPSRSRRASSRTRDSGFGICSAMMSSLNASGTGERNTRCWTSDPTPLAARTAWVASPAVGTPWWIDRRSVRTEWKAGSSVDRCVGRSRMTEFSRPSRCSTPSFRRSIASALRCGPTRCEVYRRSSSRSRSGAGMNMPTSASRCSWKYRPTRSWSFPMPKRCTSLETSSSRAFSIAPAARMNVSALTVNRLPSSVAHWTWWTRPWWSMAILVTVAWSSSWRFSASASAVSWRLKALSRPNWNIVERTTSSSSGSRRPSPRASQGPTPYSNGPRLHARWARSPKASSASRPNGHPWSGRPGRSMKSTASSGAACSPWLDQARDEPPSARPRVKRRG